MVPEWIVFGVSLAGVIISGYLCVDALSDRRILQEKLDRDPALDAFTAHRAISEVIRFFALLGFLYISIAVLLDHEGLEAFALWVLVAIPFLITASSINSWILRQRKLE